MKKGFLLILSIIQVAFLHAQVYDYVVAKDGTGNFTTIQAAINAAPTGSTRTTIFIKKGVYQEKIYMGSNSASISKVLSLIGENRDSVIITNSDYNGISKPYYTGTSNITYGTPQSATMTINCSDFYMENITVQNPYTSAQAVAIYNASDRQTFKNCRLAGFQDTHYPKKGRRGFYYKTQIEGRTDFICGGGPNYYLQCSIKSVSGGSYITAPEDVTYKATLSNLKTLYYGFIFKECDLISDGVVGSASVYLGRPWQNTSGTVFLNCRMGNHINSLGWDPWGKDVSTVCMAEFQSMNATGTALFDVSKRVSWSMQLTATDVNNFLKMTSVYASLGSSTPYDPLSLVVPPTPVSIVTKNGQNLQWTVVDGAKGYVIYADGRALGFTSTGSFTDTTTRSKTPVYTVCTVGAHGNLSLPDGSTESVTYDSLNELANGAVPVGVASTTISKQPRIWICDGQLHFDKATNFSLHDLSGRSVLCGIQVLNKNLAGLPHGIYLLRSFDKTLSLYQSKISL